MKNLLLILVVALTLASCGSTKKYIDEGEIKIEEGAKVTRVETEEKIEETKIEETEKTEEKEEKKEETHTIKENEKIEVEGDGTGDPITVETKEDKDGTKKVTVTGANKVVISEDKSDETILIEELATRNTEYQKTIEENTTTIRKLQEDLEYYKNLEEEHRLKDLERTGPSFFGYVGWGLGILALIIVIIIIWRVWRKAKRVKNVIFGPDDS